jgi:hypothetical protein
MNKPMNTVTRKTAAARGKARQALDDAADEALDTAERVASSAHRGLSRARKAAADRSAALADDLDDVAEDAGSFARRAAHGLSDKARELGDGLRGGRLPAMIDDAQAFARRNPVVVLAGAVVLGLLLSRAAAPRNGRTPRT